VPEAGDLRFIVDPVFPPDRHPADGRELGAAIGTFDVHDDQRRHDWVRGFSDGMASPHSTGHVSVPQVVAAMPDVATLPDEGGGWYDLESDDEGPFRWMAWEARIRVPDAAAGARFCVVRIFSNYHNLKQELAVRGGDRALATLPLLKRWSTYSVALPEPCGHPGCTLTFRVNALVPSASHPGDPRELGVRVGVLRFHSDAVRHELDASRQKNNELRQRELLTGATVLSSTPSTLGIDLFGKCNIKPACVYCPWDRMKALEGPNANAVIDDRTLESYGPLFRCAQSLVNCSFGEPLLHPRLEQVLELVARHGQTIELATNGQAFTARTVRALAGAPVFLYVSLDAASANTYARLRNEHWHELIAGLLAMREARQQAGGWPRLNMVFIPMRANKDDLEDYFKLCRLVEADALVLRPLLMEESQVDTERGGYRFVYEREHLGQDDLAELVAYCRVLASRYGVRVMTQFDFGKVDFGVLGTAANSPD
jgi:organic radical activating enzyme